jgi:hypothetical protein
VEDLEAFARLITALRPWLRQLVVVGGWAHRLHRFHPRAHAPAHLSPRTRDADLAFSDEGLIGDVREALTDAGFTEQQFGDDTPPASHYGLGEGQGGFYAEFLTPLFGSEEKRGRRDATVRTAGITAQKLRHLDLLLLKPWSVRVGPERGVPVTADAEVFVPNPAIYIFQKLLIHAERPPHKKAQDTLYIHDTLELFGGSLDELRRFWLEEVRPALPSKTARRAEALARELFSEVTDTIREAARIPQDRELAPENVQRACGYGLAEIFGVDRSA